VDPRREGRRKELRDEAALSELVKSYTQQFKEDIDSKSRKRWFE
jgi:hypothetical protein